MKPIFTLFLLLFLLPGCASLSNRSKSLITMSGFSACGGAIGALTAPKDENPYAHALLWGSLSGLLSGAISLFVFDENARSEKLESENGLLQKELENIKRSSFQESDLGSFGLGNELSELPPSLRGLVKPSSTRLSKVTSWTPLDEDPMTLIGPHLVLRLDPSSLMPGKKIENTKKE